MRTIITLKPAANGKVNVTRDHFILVKRSMGYELYEGAGVDGGSWLVRGKGERVKYNNRRDAVAHIEVSTDDAVVSEVRGENQESEGKWSETFGPDGKKIKVWVPSKKTASEAAGSKDAGPSELRRDVQELLEHGFDVDALKARRAGLSEGGVTYAYSRSQKNPVGVEVMYFKPTSRAGVAADADSSQVERAVSLYETGYSNSSIAHSTGLSDKDVALIISNHEAGYNIPGIIATLKTHSSDAKDLFIGTRGLSERNEGFLDAAYDATQEERQNNTNGLNAPKMSAAKLDKKIKSGELTEISRNGSLVYVGGKGYRQYIRVDDELTTVRTAGPAEKGIKIPMPKDPKERVEYEAAIARRKAAGGGKFVGDAPTIRYVSPDEVRVGQMMLMENEGGWGRVQRAMGVKVGNLNMMRIKTDLGERDYAPGAKLQVKTTDVSILNYVSENNITARQGKGHGARDAAPRRRVVIHNHLPRAAKDEISREARAKAQVLMNTDNRIMAQFGWKSGTQVENHWDKYKLEVAKAVPSAYSQDVGDALEDENFHLMYQALRELGKIRK